MSPLLALGLILAAGLLLLALISSGASRGPRGHRQHLDRALVASRWQAIRAGADSGGAGLKNAVMEADKLLDYAMQSSGFAGTTMGERLKSPRARNFSDLDAVWRAHKLRNHLAHDVTADLVASQAQEALRDFERGLNDLGAL